MLLISMSFLLVYRCKTGRRNSSQTKSGAVSYAKVRHCILQGEHKVFSLITNIYYKKPTWNTNIFMEDLIGLVLLIIIILRSSNKDKDLFVFHVVFL